MSARGWAAWAWYRLDHVLCTGPELLSSWWYRRKLRLRAERLGRVYAARRAGDVLAEHREHAWYESCGTRERPCPCGARPMES